MLAGGENPPAIYVMLSMLAGGLLSAFNTMAQAAIASDQNKTNLQLTRETNAANLQQVRETNAANAEQAELAYQRSKPINQVAQMMQAGLSKPAALAALSGGGSYSAPVMQAGSATAPQVDYSQMIGALERANNIPANVQQFELQNQQIQSVKDEMIRKQEMHDAQLRAINERLERERDEEYRKKYGQNQVEMTDKLASLIIEKAASKGLDYSSYTDEAQLVKDLDLNNERLWRTAPDVARQRVRETLITRANELRANEANERSRIASDDAHRMAILNQMLAKSELNEREKSLVYKLEILANNVALGKYQVDDANKDAIIRDAGFTNEKEAAAALRAAENLRTDYTKEKARRLANAPGALYVIDLMLDKLNPLREIIHIGGK